MRVAGAERFRTGLAVLALLPLAIPLAGCGMSRDEALAEKVARAEAAARRAEAAQSKAESAARLASGQSGQSFASMDEPPTVDGGEVVGNDDQFDNTIAEPNSDDQ